MSSLHFCSDETCCFSWSTSATSHTDRTLPLFSSTFQAVHCQLRCKQETQLLRNIGILMQVSSTRLLIFCWLLLGTPMNFFWLRFSWLKFWFESRDKSSDVFLFSDSSDVSQVTDTYRSSIVAYHDGFVVGGGMNSEWWAFDWLCAAEHESFGAAPFHCIHLLPKKTINYERIHHEVLFCSSFCRHDWFGFGICSSYSALCQSRNFYAFHEFCRKNLHHGKLVFASNSHSPAQWASWWVALIYWMTSSKILTKKSCCPLRI